MWIDRGQPGVHLVVNDRAALAAVATVVRFVTGQTLYK
jgi:hypothetical protein